MSRFSTLFNVAAIGGKAPRTTSIVRGGYCSPARLSTGASSACAVVGELGCAGFNIYDWVMERDSIFKIADSAARAWALHELNS